MQNQKPKPAWAHSTDAVFPQAIYDMNTHLLVQSALGS